MATVENGILSTHVPEEWVVILYGGLKLTSKDEEVREADAAKLFTWVEDVVDKVYEQPDAATALANVPEFETLGKLVSQDLVPLITDDGALTFVSAAPYILTALGVAEGENPCADCDDTDCPLHPSKQRLN